MLVKSQNQKYIIKVDCSDNDNCYIIIYRMDYFGVVELFRRIIRCSLGNKRVTISNDGRYVVSALYEKVLFMYETGYEEPIWTIHTKKNIESVFIDERDIYCAYSGGEIEIFNIKGESQKKNRNIEYISEDQYGYIYLVNYSYFNINKKKIYPNSTKFINAVKTPSGVVLAEIRGKLMYISEEGNKIWEYENEINSHYIKLAYSEINDMIIAISMNYVDKTEKIKFHFITLQGNTIDICEMERVEYEFCLGNSYVIDCNLQLYRLDALCSRTK